jgi:DNA ligase-1
MLETPSEEELRRRKERKDEPPSEEEMRRRAERKKKRDKIHNDKPESKAQKKVYDEIYLAKPEIKERNSQASRVRNAEARERVVQEMRKTDPTYEYPRKVRLYKWSDADSVKSFFDEVGEKLKIVEKPDWYHVSNAQIRKNGGGGAISVHGTLGFALKFAYPDYEWDMEVFQYNKKLAAQREVRIMLEEIVPEGVVLLENFTKHPALYLLGSTRPSSYDFYMLLPGGRKLAIEYQGEQHYMDIRPVYSPLSERQKRDSAKLKSARDHGITIVYVPYWWDRKSDSLSSTLHQCFPDIFPKTDSPSIPTELPPDYEKNKKPGILTNKNIMMGHDFVTGENEKDVKGWFLSEKLDGMRAYWDGKGNYWSKNGKVINIPESFKQLPPYPLDGELWCGYGTNQSEMVKVKISCRGKKPTKPMDTEFWEKVKYCVFDAPNIKKSYDKRHSYLEKFFSQYCNSNILLIPIQKCEGKEHLHNHLEKIVKKGGEGIMIYKPVVHYLPGRCKNVLKLKKYYESTITFLERSETTRHFKCQQNDGSEVTLRVDGGYWKRKPEVGSKIPVRHQGYFPDSPNFKYPQLFEPLTAEEKQEARKKEKIAKKPNNNTE